MEFNVHELSENQLEELSEKIVIKIMDAQSKKRKMLKDNAFHNTRMLLRNYHKLKKHCDIVEKQVEEDFTTMWNHWRFDIDSLLENRAKTVKIMKHVDSALIALKEEDERAYNVLQMKYLLEKNYSDDMIADRYYVDRRTIGKWIKKSIEALSVILFGVDMVTDI